MPKKLIKHTFGPGPTAGSTPAASSANISSASSSAAATTPASPTPSTPLSSTSSQSSHYHLSSAPTPAAHHHHHHRSNPSGSEPPPPQQTPPAPTTYHSLPPVLAALVPASLAAAHETRQPLPRLVVFDLDYTLWPFWVDTHPTPPLKAVPNSSPPGSSWPAGGAAAATVTDRWGETYAFFEHAPSLLWALPQLGIRIGVASRTPAPDLAREMLKLMHISSPPPPDDAPPSGSAAAKKEKPRRALDFFDAGLEIYPGTKLQHMRALSRRTGIAFEDMLFFDDEPRNREVERLGVTMHLVQTGVNWTELERGVETWRQRRRRAEWSQEGDE